MNQTSIERLVEELCTYISEQESGAFYSNTGEDYAEWLADGSEHKDFLREKLTSALSQARQEGREEALKLALELVEKNDPNVEMGRMTNPHYWGNCLRRELQEALTTEGK